MVAHTGPTAELPDGSDSRYGSDSEYGSFSRFGGARFRNDHDQPPVEATRLFNRRSTAALMLAVIGSASGYYGFVSGIDRALSSTAAGLGASIFIFFAGVILAILGVVLAVVELLRSRRKTIPVSALIVGLLPIAGLIVIVLGVRR